MKTFSKLQVPLCLALNFCISVSNSHLMYSRWNILTKHLMSFWWMFFNYSFSSENIGRSTSHVFSNSFTQIFITFAKWIKLALCRFVWTSVCYIWKCVNIIFKFQHNHPRVMIKLNDFCIASRVGTTSLLLCHFKKSLNTVIPLLFQVSCK